jgi:DNA-binding transcriptional MerR regulator
MRIGELAAMVGLSTRAIRHYHHWGVLPEPARRPNGYREYGLRDVILLARVRRLTEIGLSLDEVRDALADHHDLVEILTDLDNDLARQEARIRERRTRLATLVEHARSGTLHPDDFVSPEMADVLGSSVTAMERELFTLADTVATPADRDRVVAMLRNPSDRGPEFHRRLEALADAPVDDPRVADLAADMVDDIPPDLLATLAADVEDPFSVAVLDALAPAQAEVIRRVVLRVTEKS